MTPEYMEALKQASIRKLRGLGHLALGDDPLRAREVLLEAARYELEALRLLGPEADAEAVERHIGEIIHALMQAALETKWLKTFPRVKLRRKR